jgi:asparagine synthase (glutamine-hydrolysing)
VSGLIAVVGAPGSAEDGAGRLMLARAASRGPDLARWWSGEDGLLGVCRAEWELAPDFADGAMVLDRHPVVLVADASLYYRDDLRRALRGAGIRLEGNSPTHLIAAAYQAWGSGLLDVIEGDYAFVLWDRHQRQLLAARDFAGTRPLFFAHVGDRLILGSSLTAVAEHPAVPRDLNRMALAEDLVGASSTAVRETAFHSVERLPAGSRLLWRPGTAPRVERFWEPPRFERGDGPPSREAAEQLRAVLRAAVRERLADDGPTAVWTSGGFDSPSVFALAHSAARQAGRRPVVPVSMSYPVGDPGREDELVEAVARLARVPIHWVRIGDVPGLPDPRHWGQRRDQPFAHPYEEWNRALARGTREAGARVIMGGNGGDQFFSVSPVFLADLARSGRWLELASEAKAIGFRWRSLRELFHWAIQPALPAAALGLAKRLRGGRPLRPHLATAAPDWLGLSPSCRAALSQRQWTYALRRPDESLGSAESAWYLTTTFGQRICAMVAEIALTEGAEVRSPMYDRRVMEFMARRPREDRYSLGETKILLRQAMQGLLPAEHLAPRPRRTGLPSAYLHRVRREALPRWAETAGGQFRLADLGLVQPESIAVALARYLGNPRWEGSLGSELFNLFSTEFWLRAHRERAPSPVAMVA